MSLVDPTLPTSGIALTRDVRRNFEIIKQELEIIEAFMDAGQTVNNPIFTGTTRMEDAIVTGDLTVDGTITPQSIAAVSSQASPTLQTSASVTTMQHTALDPLTFRLMADGSIHVTGQLLIATNALAAEAIIIAAGVINAAYRPTVSTKSFIVGGFNVVWQFNLYTDGRVGMLNKTGANPLTTAAETANFSHVYRL